MGGGGGGGEGVLAPWHIALDRLGGFRAFWPWVAQDSATASRGPEVLC